jgi:hypothetical protein
MTQPHERAGHDELDIIGVGSDGEYGFHEGDSRRMGRAWVSGKALAAGILNRSDAS